MPYIPHKIIGQCRVCKHAERLYEYVCIYMDICVGVGVYTPVIGTQIETQTQTPVRIRMYIY